MPHGHDGATNPRAYRVGYSEASGARFKRREMVYAKRRWTMPYRTNYLYYSSYNTAGWETDGIDQGMITVGPYADQNVVSHTPNEDGTDTSLENGIQTWSSSFYPGSEYVGHTTTMTTDGYNMTDTGGFVFSFEFIAHQVRPSTKYTVQLGNYDGTHLEWWKTWELVGSNRVWCLVPTLLVVGSLESTRLIFRVIADPFDSKWAWTNAQVEKGVSQPGVFVETAGSQYFPDPATYNGQNRGIGIIHTKEYELVQEDWEGIVTPREGQDQGSFVTPVEDI